jgi:hypothetical protein
MKILIFFLIISTLILSCIESEPTKSSYIVLNNSNHKICINEYSKNYIFDSLILNPMQEKEYLYYDKAGDVLFPITGDSVVINYDDSIKITHTREKNQVASRSILLKEYWEGGIVNDLEFKYKYIFTEADYLEAKGK